MASSLRYGYTLTMCDYMEEVRPKTKKIKNWNNF